MAQVLTMALVLMLVLMLVPVLVWANLSLLLWAGSALGFHRRTRGGTGETDRGTSLSSISLVEVKQNLLVRALIRLGSRLQLLDREG